MRTMQYVALLLILALVPGLIGCGGGGGSNKTPAVSLGGLRFTIKWPPPSRLIPAGAYSIRIVLSAPGQTIAPQLIARPSGTDTSTATFDKLNTGNVTVTATAYPNADGTGNPQASGIVIISVPSGSIKDAALSLSSAIQTVAISPASANLGVGSALTLAASATDATGAVVLTGGTWTWTSDNPAVATITSNGAMATVQGLSPGTVTLRAQETESQKTVQISLTVTQPQVVITSVPTTLAPGATFQFGATVNGVVGGAISWSVVEATGGKITSTGLYTAPATQGTYHVMAAVQSNPSQNATVVVIVSGTSNPVLAGWTKFRSDARNSGYGGGNGATGVLKWHVGAGGNVTAAEKNPAIGSDGTVYTWSAAGVFSALNPDTGAEKWRFVPPSVRTTPGYSAPALSSDGSLYVGGADGTFYALDSATGNVKWQFQTDRNDYPIATSPAIGGDGTVYFGALDHKVYALDGSSGAKKWDFTIDGLIGISSPAIGSDGTVYIGGNDKLYALDGSTGEKKWEFQAGNQVSSTPLIGPDGTIYFTAWDVYAVNGATGTKKWQVTLGSIMTGQQAGTLAMGKDGTLYTGVTDRNLYALNSANGAKKWNLTLDRAPSVPSVGSDGTVYVWGGKLYAVDGGTGTTKWTYAMNNGLSPAIGSDGTLYIESDGVYAIK